MFPSIDKSLFLSKIIAMSFMLVRSLKRHYLFLVLSDLLFVQVGALLEMKLFICVSVSHTETYLTSHLQ